MVGIILVNYNGYKETEECIESIKESNANDYQIIVVDNCSTDDSRQKLRTYESDPIVKVLYSDKNGGFSYGNNIGIKYAAQHMFEFVLLLNNDTLVDANFIEQLMSPFKVDQKCGLSIGKILYADEPNRIWYAGGSFSWKTARTEHFYIGKTDDVKNTGLQSVSFATGCCMMIPIRVINEVGYLDESFFMYDEDCDYCLRILNSGYKIVYNSKAIIYHKIGSSAGRDSKFSQYYIIRNHYRIIKRYISKGYKPIAYLYFTGQSIFRCIKHQYNFSVYFKALGAFLKE